MKIIKSSILIIILIQGISLTAQDKKYILDTTSYGDPMLFGQVTSEAFMQDPFNEWYVKNSDEYKINTNVFNAKVKSRSTWVPDVEIVAKKYQE